MPSSNPLLLSDFSALLDAYLDDYTPLVHLTTLTGRNYMFKSSENIFKFVKYQLTVAFLM
jgi:hypothetical protein